VRRVLFIAATTGYQIRSFGEAARALGIGLDIASDRCDRLEDPWWDHAIPVRFHDDGHSVAAVRDAFGSSRPDGVLAVGDRPTVLAARLTEAFGLPGNPPAAAEASRNKLVSRALFRAAGLATPWFGTLPLDADPRPKARTLPYPVVVKPLALSGSRGVIRANDDASLVDAIGRLARILESPDVRSERDRAHELALVESFVPGREFAVEGLLDRGELTVLAIFDKPDPLDGPFFEETLYVTPSGASAETQAGIRDAVAAAARALGLRHGPVHAECRVTPPGDTGSEVYVLEVAARPIGGLCSRALRFTDGRELVSLEELLLRHAVGEDVSKYRRETAASGVMMIPIPRRGVYRGVAGVSEAQRVDGIEEIRITARQDALLVPLPEGRSYLGFIFARGTTAARVEQALREAHGRLEFSIEREIAVAG
jgi:biotin carboxylase